MLRCYYSFDLQLLNRIRVDLDLYQISGVKVKRLVNEEKKPGTYEMEIDLEEFTKRGLFLCTLKTNEGIQTKKIIKL